MKRLLFAILALTISAPLTAQMAPLTVQQIMADPDTWIGSSPAQPYWSADSDTLFFNWNPMGAFHSDSLFMSVRGAEPVQVPINIRVRDRFFMPNPNQPLQVVNGSGLAFSGGSYWLVDMDSGSKRQLTDGGGYSNARMTPDGSGVVMNRDGNVYRMDLASGLMTRLTNIRSGEAESEKEEKKDAQDQWLVEQQEFLFEIIRKRKDQREAREEASEVAEAYRDAGIPAMYRGKKSVRNLQLDPTGRFVSIGLGDAPSRGGGSKRTIVQDYVTASGYAEDLNARSKVGVESSFSMTLMIQDLEADTVHTVDLKNLPGAYDVPVYLAEQGTEVDSSQARTLNFTGAPIWSMDGKHLVATIRAYDNKDRWIVAIDPETADIRVLDRQHDEAWIAGPGISRFGSGTMGWMPDGKSIYFQSEETGYSHLYTVDVATGRKRALTSGDFEIYGPRLSRDGKTWFFASSEESPYVQHVYSMPVNGGKRTKITTMDGRNDFTLSPDESKMAIRYSYSNQPPDLYLMDLSDPGNPERLTESTTEEWRAYDWRDPDIIEFKASDGVDVPARIYMPENPNGAAVLFVHGAGYLHNVHKWWSNYFREFMFHNLLADKGYIVVDVDYRGSAGYGRDWRTAIYRHMGGRDLQDYVDASRWLQSEHNIDPDRIGIYGGSYGGFITLMALFNEAADFGAGAALRSVTDWAHYNHGYTANILNTPATDSLAIARSSPIYFAEGLEDPLLIAHGMIDTNVQFQDVVRLAQRLIELGKEDWEMAVYPIEGHGFREPSSWTDEYRRILKLFDDELHPE